MILGDDELGVRTIETPHHCWKDERIQELEEALPVRLTEAEAGRLAALISSVLDEPGDLEAVPDFSEDDRVMLVRCEAKLTRALAGEEAEDG